MIIGFLVGIAVAYALSWFHIDAVIIAGVKQLFNMDIGTSGYYLLMGLACGISRVILGGMITGLIVAYIFTFFELDVMIIQGLKEVFKLNLTIDGYYIIFAIMGAVFSLLRMIRFFAGPLFSSSRDK